VILASTSPRRRELLQQIGVCFEAVSAAVDETPSQAECPEAYVRRVAAEKSLAGQRLSGASSLPVLGADTEVVLDGEVFGKPQHFEQARSMLTRLSGRVHVVLSAVSLRQGDRHWQAISVSSVTFRDLSREDIEAYWASGEPRDKAGAYAIQGRGALFVRHLEGSFSGVMGLPLYETGLLLKEIGIDTSMLLQKGTIGCE
jgi:septum formation protein